MEEDACLAEVKTWASSCLLWSSKMAILASSLARCWRKAFSSELWRLTVLSPRVTVPANKARCSFSSREFSSLSSNYNNKMTMDDDFMLNG